MVIILDRKVLIMAHRGFSGERPENTLASFQEAVESGADGVEFDVQLSSDGIPVVIHNENLERTTNGKGLVKNTTRENLSVLDAGSHFDPVYSDEGIPTLKEVLDVVKDMSVINIEFKNNKIDYGGLEKKVLDIVKGFNLIDKVVFSSFNHYSLIIIKKLQPDCQAGCLYYAKIYHPWKYAKYLDIKNIHPHYSAIDKQTVEKCREQNINVNVFGTNDEEKIKYLIDIGVNIVICDYPDVAIRIRDEI